MQKNFIINSLFPRSYNLEWAFETLERTIDDPQFGARQAVLMYIKQYDREGHGQILGGKNHKQSLKLRFGCGSLVNGTMVLAYNILPFPNAPFIPVTLGCVLGPSLREMLIGYRVAQNKQRLDTLLKGFQERDQNQLIGGLLQRWYGDTLPRSPAMPDPVDTSGAPIRVP